MATQLEAPGKLKGLNRLAWVLAGIGWFLWFAYEDQTFEPVLLLSVFFAAAIGLTVFRRLTKERRFTSRQMLVRTTISGLIALRKVRSLDPAEVF